MNRDLFIPILITLLAIFLFWYSSQFLSLVIIFIPAAIVNLIFYFLIFYKNEIQISGVLKVYLICLAVQFLHFAEEYLMNFGTVVPLVLGLKPFNNDALVLFNMIAYAIFVLGTLVLISNVKYLIIIPTFFLFVGVTLNSIGHILLSVYQRSYMPGLYTALLYLPLIPLIIRELKSSVSDQNISEANL